VKPNASLPLNDFSGAWRVIRACPFVRNHSSAAPHVTAHRRIHTPHAAASARFNRIFAGRR
jgi:hypothetical protein